jgi:hypothetical protein
MRTQVMRACASSIVLSIFLVWPPTASADSIARSEARLDWTGLTFAISSGLTVTRIDQADFAAGSWVSTTLGGTTQDEKISHSFQDWSNTSASSAYSTSSGFGGAQASTSNGLLMVRSEAGTTALESSEQAGQSSAHTDSIFWLYGTGVGTLTVTVPYTLSVECNLSDAIREDTAALASVSLMAGPGVGWHTTDALSCSDSAHPGIKNGMLMLSKDFSDPTWGPLTGIWASANTSAMASVPEPSTLLLLVMAGITGVVFSACKHWRK